jgi:bifunctional DNase/RNase
MADEHAEEPDFLREPPAFFPYEKDELPDGTQDLDRTLVEIQFDHIVVSESDETRQYYVLLTDGRRHLMMTIGGYEATAISYGAEGVQTDRPMTHDLLVKFLESFGGKVERIVIDDLWNSTYFAKLHIKKGKEEIEVDCRPSDAIALAVRLDVPMFAISGILKD